MLQIGWASALSADRMRPMRLQNGTQGTEGADTMPRFYIWAVPPQARIPLMKNWKLLTEASGLEIPDSEIDRLIAPLEGLDASFRKIAFSFPADTDSAQVFEAEPESK